METAKMSELPQFEYDDDALVPVISKDLLRLHHAKQHAAYVNGANTILKMMNKSRDEMADFNTKGTFKDLSFHIDGYLLHSLFWENLAPSKKDGGGKPSGQLSDQTLDPHHSVSRSIPGARLESTGDQTLRR